jgi:hypothetical protein
MCYFGEGFGESAGWAVAGKKRGKDSVHERFSDVGGDALMHAWLRQLNGSLLPLRFFWFSLPCMVLSSL